MSLYRFVAPLVTAFALSAPAVAAPLAHMVFFTLTDDTPENRAKLVALCEEHLCDHEGTEYFSVGVVADDLDRPVNDREFDVALHMVFAQRADHDRYQAHARHLKFIEEGAGLWAKVRVFDSNLGVKAKAE